MTLNPEQIRGGGEGCKSCEENAGADSAMSPSTPRRPNGARDRAGARPQRTQLPHRGGAAGRKEGSPRSRRPRLLLFSLPSRAPVWAGAASPAHGHLCTLPDWRQPCWGGHTTRLRRSVMAAPRPWRAVNTASLYA